MSNLRTPLYQWHVDHKARMVPFGGWEMPVQYAGIGPEHKAVRGGAGLFDISHMARVSFGGKDALALLEHVFTNSVATMKDGQVRYGLVCNESGGILDDVLVYKWPYGYAAVINASNRTKILAWLKVHAAGRDVQIQDQTLDTTMIAVQGPKSVELVAGLLADDVSGLKYYFATPSRYKDRPCVVSRTGYTGEDGFEVIVPNALGVTLWDEFISKGAVPCGLGARDTLRLEAGMPLYGHEIDAQHNPIEAGLGFGISFAPEKGDWIGRAALERVQAAPRRRLIGITTAGPRAPRQGYELYAGAARVGYVVSGSVSPTVATNIGSAYVSIGYDRAGTALELDINGKRQPCVVQELPFYSRTRK